MGKFIWICLLTAVLWKIGRSDCKTYTIPASLCAALLALGAVKVFWMGMPPAEAVSGVMAAGVPLLFLYAVSGGRAIGGGDVKLMMSAGVCLGGEKTLLAMLIGSVAAVVVHPLRRKFAGASSEVAFGPYLAFGIWAAEVCCWYWK